MRSIIISTGGTNAGAFTNYISDGGLISLTIFQSDSMSSTSMTGSILIYHES